MHIDQPCYANLAHVRFCQERCYLLQNLCVTSIRVVEAGSIDEIGWPPGSCAEASYLHLGSTGLERVSDFDLLIGEQVDQRTFAGPSHAHNHDDNGFIGLMPMFGRRMG